MIKKLNKIIDFMEDHTIAIYGTWAIGMLLWLLENDLKGNND